MPSNVIELDKSQLDNTIRFVEDKYVSENGIARAEFHPLGNKVVFQSKGFQVVWLPISMKYIDEFGIEDDIYSVQDAPLEVKGNKARFNRSMPDVDDMFIVDGDRLKHSIMIQGWQREPAPWLSGNIDFVISGTLEFDHSLSVHSMGMQLVGPFESGESIEIRNGDEVIFTLPKIVAYDSNVPERAEAFGRYRVTSNENGVLAFDIVMDNAWMASDERVYPVLIDPTVVVASAYDTSGNGRKLVRLSNGWLVAGVYDSTRRWVIFYKSADNGTTWTQLCYSARDTISWAITSKGTNVYVLISPTGTGNNAFHYFDATTVTNEALPIITNVDSGQSTFGSGASLAINDAGTELHGAWVSKNPTYPNSFNIRYAKGTIDGNGNVSWGSVTQLTATNSGSNYLNPYVIVKADNNPLVVYDFGTYILSRAFNGSTWDAEKVVEFISSYGRSSPCALVKKYGSNIGRIFVGWHGLDPTDTTKQNVRIAYYDDGGAYWTVIGKITTGNSIDRKNVKLAENKNGDVYAFYEDNGNIVYQKCANGTTTFGGLTTIAPGTNPSVMEREIDSMIGFIWKDATSVKYDSLLFNVAPTAPTNLFPNGVSVDRAQVQRLSWKFNDPNAGDGQSKFDLQWRKVGVGTWNTVTQVTPNQYWDAPAGTFPKGQIEWQVRAYDRQNVVGPYSAQAVFTAGDKPAAPTITEPSGTIAVSRPNIAWSSADQASYQVQVLDDQSTVVWDTNEVVSTNKVVTVGVDLANNKTYTFKVRIKNADGLWSDWASVSLAVSFTPPLTPLLSIAPDNANARNRVIVTNPFNGLVNLLATDGNCEDTSKLAYTGGTAVLDSTRKTTGSNSVKVTKTATTTTIDPLTSKRIYPTVGEYYLAIADVYLENVASQVYFSALANGVTRTGKVVTTSSGSSYSATTVGQFVPVIYAFRIDTVATPGASYIYPRLYHGGTVGDSYNVDSFRVFKITQAEYDALPTNVNLATAQAIAAQYPYLDPTNPMVVSNEVFRRKAGETSWQRIAQGIAPNSVYDDYAVASGVDYEYKVKANGNNGTYTESDVSAGRVTFSGVWLHCVDDPAGTVHRFALSSGNSDEWRTDGSLMKFAGRKRPVAAFGENEDGRIVANLQMLRNRGDREALQNIVSRKTPVCYRDNRGRKMFGVIFQLPSNDAFYGYSAQVSIDEIDYKEEV